MLLFLKDTTSRKFLDTRIISYGTVALKFSYIPYSFPFIVSLFRHFLPVEGSERVRFWSARC